MTWQEQAASSHYRTAVAIRDQLHAGNVAEATAGIEELIEALATSYAPTLKSQLTRLMAHVFKWQSQPERRTRSWAASIRSARKEILDIQEETPSLTDEVIRSLWVKCLESARDQAEAEMDQEVVVAELSWDDVFATDYRV